MDTVVISYMDTVVISYIEQCTTVLTDGNLLTDDTFHFHQTEEEGLWEKFQVKEDQDSHTLRLISLQNGKEASEEVMLEFLNDSTDSFQSDDELLVFNEESGTIDRAVILDELSFEAYLVITKHDELQIASRVGEKMHYRYLLNSTGGWTDSFKASAKTKEALSKITENVVTQAHDILAEEIPELGFQAFLQLDSIGAPFCGLIGQFINERIESETEKKQVTSGNNMERDLYFGEHIKSAGPMSSKNIDDIQDADVGIVDGQRYLIMNAPRYNQYIAYVNFEDPSTSRGGLPIHFGIALKEKRHDDYEIKIITQPGAKQVVIQDNQVVRDLTDYLQMTEDERFLNDLIYFISNRDDSIVSGTRCPLVIVPDVSNNKMVIAYKTGTTGQSGTISARDLSMVAGGNRGMSAYIDLDILGGYINDRSK